MHAESQAILKNSGSGPAHPKQLVMLFFLTAAAFLVHGYHPFVEDAEIYVPGIKQLLNPALYPYNTGFFASHASMTLFPNVIAWSVRITHFPLTWILLAWHFTCIFLLLLACWRLGRICFGSSRAAWGSAAMIASLLTIPVAGTALYIMDQYLNPRGFSTAAAMWIVLAVVQRKYVQTAVWVMLTALIHPLMAVFGLAFAVLLIWRQRMQPPSPVSLNFQQVSTLVIFPMTLFPPVTSAYRQALDSHSYFFLLRWEWYEWLGIFGPLVIFWCCRRSALGQKLAILEVLCFTSMIFGILFFVAALMITVPSQFMRWVELQPMRGLLLIYVLLFTIAGGLLAEHVLKAKMWRWLAVFIPLCGGMFYAQRQLFAATPQVEWPGNRTSVNDWMQAFVWIRNNTPVNAYFALDPDHMRLAGEDQQGFRAVAERSMLADRVKDSGAVTMFPALAGDWLEQVSSEYGWKNFGPQDFDRLRDKYGVGWVVLQQPGLAGLECPYRNAALLVCRIGDERRKAEAQ
jgi:hypothetical protein